jgi:hypothetical protein
MNFFNELMKEKEVLNKILFKFTNQLRQNILFQKMKRINRHIKKMGEIICISNLKKTNTISDIILRDSCIKEVLVVCLNQLRYFVTSASKLCAKSIASIHFLHFYMLLFGILSRIQFYCDSILADLVH